MIATEALHKEVINTLDNTFINREKFINRQAFFMLCFQNESINKCYNAHNVHWDITPLSYHSFLLSTTPFSFTYKTVQAPPPYLGNPPFILAFCYYPLKIGFFSKPPY